MRPVVDLLCTYTSALNFRLNSDKMPIPSTQAALHRQGYSVCGDYPPRNRIRGFTLVEVVIALGIISFALVALIGLLPVGLDTFRRAVDATTTSQIAQELLSSATHAKYSALGQMAGTPYYFDDQGKSGTGIDATNYVYRADVAVSTSSDIPQSSGALANPNLATVKITITKISAPQDARTFQGWVADNGL